MNLPTALRLVACGVALSVTLGAQGQTPTPAPTPAASPRPANAPRLLVVLVLDQFRADYIEMYGRQWTKGLRRLVDKGAEPQAGLVHALKIRDQGLEAQPPRLLAQDLLVAYDGPNASE